MNRGLREIYRSASLEKKRIRKRYSESLGDTQSRRREGQKSRLEKDGQSAREDRSKGLLV